MLKAAQLYVSELNAKMLEIWYDPEYVFCTRCNCCLSLSDNNYKNHEFVSVNKDGDIIGYISYKIDHEIRGANDIIIISFQKGNIEFIKDVHIAIYNIFNKFNINRVQWYCFADNPAIAGYRKFIKKYGGVECAYFRQDSMLQDGKLHDSVIFEILRDEFDHEKLKKVINK